MRIFAITSIATLMAAPVLAQDVYGGIAADYGLPHSGDSQTSLSGLVGLQFGSGAIGYGVEADYGFGVAGLQDRDTGHLRGLLTYDLGSVTGIATLGFTRYDIEGDDVYSGYNFGLGVQAPVGEKLLLRGEIFRDNMDGYPTNVTTSRVGVLYKF